MIVNLFWLWIIIIFGGLIIDVISTNFLLFPFSIGALIALISGLIGIPIVFQIIIFLIVSGITLVTLAPILKKYIKKTQVVLESRENTYMGSRHTVLNTGEFYCVKIDGTFWKIESTEKIRSGDKVIVVGMNGNKLNVEKENLLQNKELTDGK